MNYDGDYTRYSPYLVISEESYQALKENPAKKLRIYWSKGYEDYEVDYPENLVKQLNCIE